MTLKNYLFILITKNCTRHHRQRSLIAKQNYCVCLSLLRIKLYFIVGCQNRTMYTLSVAKRKYDGHM